MDLFYNVDRKIWCFNRRWSEKLGWNLKKNVLVGYESVAVFVVRQVWWWFIAKMENLSYYSILFWFPFAGSGNHMATRWVFCQISLQTVLGHGRGGRGGKICTKPASWINFPCSCLTRSTWECVVGGRCRQRPQDTATGSAQATGEPQPEAVVSWSLS